MYQLGKWSRPDDDVLWLARLCLVMRRDGWRAEDLVRWIREQD